MPRSFKPGQKKLRSNSFVQFFQPVKNALLQTPMLKAREDRPLQMTIEDQLKVLVFYPLEEHVSARHMLQVLEQDDFARENKVESKKAVFQRPSIHEDWTNS